MKIRVGLIGMGLMGQAFIANLKKENIFVQGFDVDPLRMEELKKMGGEPLSSPSQVAKNVSHLILSLPNSDIVQEVIFGNSGVVEGASEGLHICDTTTSRPQDSENFASELEKLNIKFLDTAVSGTSTMAMDGDLVVVAGGKKTDFEQCRNVLSGFSRAAYFMGPPGSGARTKLIINLVLAGNRLALAEGLVLGEKSGLELHSLLQVLRDGASASKTMIDKGPKMIDADYSKQGQVKLSLKDSRLMIELGQKSGSPVLLTSIYSQILQVAKEKGYGEKDTVAFFEILRGMAGLEERPGIDDVPFG
ncbi:MAG: NAD(P)-dependent oxidoreductase [Pseudomonadota bacterium]|nr:NAD(P)-dependent oxidoreductase [Pseudomonadota bacterium]